MTGGENSSASSFSFFGLFERFFFFLRSAQLRLGADKSLLDLEEKFSAFFSKNILNQLLEPVTL
jgi:hypothetical protein